MSGNLVSRGIAFCIVKYKVTYLSTGDLLLQKLETPCADEGVQLYAHMFAVTAWLELKEISSL